MRSIEFEDGEVIVDANSPEPLVSIAHWLKDSEFRQETLARFASRLFETGIALTGVCEEARWLILDIASLLLAGACNLTITVRLALSATFEASAHVTAETSVNS